MKNKYIATFKYSLGTSDYVFENLLLELTDEDIMDSSIVKSVVHDIVFKMKGSPRTPIAIELISTVPSTAHVTSNYANECDRELYDFIVQSNAIERIYRVPTEGEIKAAKNFLSKDELTVDDFVHFVNEYAPGKKLRSEKHLNVRIGDHLPMQGGIALVIELEKLIDKANNVSKDYYQCIHKPEGVPKFISVFEIHAHYEHIHPFMDGNGRSGRMLWYWLMKKCNLYMAPLGFTQTWYYHSLDYYRHINRL